MKKLYLTDTRTWVSEWNKDENKWQPIQGNDLINILTDIKNHKTRLHWRSEYVAETVYMNEGGLAV